MTDTSSLEASTNTRPETSMSTIVKTAEDFVKHHFANHDPSHDWNHIHRVRLMALHLSQDPSLPSKPDLLVLELGALFHDMCDRKYLPLNQTEPVSARAVLAPFFVSFDKDEIALSQRETIEKIVDNVSWSKDEARRRITSNNDDDTTTRTAYEQWENTCPEFWCVSDSDRLDAIGSIGILRAAAYSAVKGQPLHIPPNNPKEDSVPPAEQGQGYNHSAIAHFHDKLLRIKGQRLRTAWAKEEAERRQQMMQSFLMELDIEWLVTAQGKRLSLTAADDEELNTADAQV